MTPTTEQEKTLLWFVRDLVLQGCTTTYPEVFSGFIGIYADALILLNEYGLLREFRDDGRRCVDGRMLEPEEFSRRLEGR